MCLEVTGPNTLRLETSPAPHHYTFDCVAGEAFTQEALYTGAVRLAPQFCTQLVGQSAAEQLWLAALWQEMLLAANTRLGAGVGARQHCSVSTPVFNKHVISVPLANAQWLGDPSWTTA